MVFTNAVGVAFTATLLSAGDAGATFVFPEDGATNTLAFSQLSRESAARVCEATGYVPVPPALAATHSLAKGNLARLAAMLEDGRIDANAAQVKRRAVLAAFERVCREKGLAEAEIEKLKTTLPGAPL